MTLNLISSTFLNFAINSKIKDPITINELIVDYKKGREVGSSNYVNKGIPFIRVSDINDNDLNLKQTNKKIHESLFKELKENFCPKKGELLYTIVGTIFELCNRATRKFYC